MPVPRRGPVAEPDACQLLGAAPLRARGACWPSGRAPSGCRRRRRDGPATQFLALALLLVARRCAGRLARRTRAACTLGLALDRADRLLPVARAAAAAARCFGIAAMLRARAGRRAAAGERGRTASEPWFDYKAFAEGLGPDAPVRFDWGHSYGPITWPRERRARFCASHRGGRPTGRSPASTTSTARRGPSAAPTGAGATSARVRPLRADWQGAGTWRIRSASTLRRIATDDVIGAGPRSADRTPRSTVRPSGRRAGSGASRRRCAAATPTRVQRLVPPVPRAARHRRPALDARPSRSSSSLTIPTATERPLPSRRAGRRAARRRMPAEASELRSAADCGRTSASPRSSPFGRAARSRSRRSETLVRSQRAAPRRCASRPDTPGRRRASQKRPRCGSRGRRTSTSPTVDRYLHDGFSVRRDAGPGVAGLGRRSTGSCSRRKSGYCQHFSGGNGAACCGWAACPPASRSGFSPGGCSERRRRVDRARHATRTRGSRSRFDGSRPGSRSTRPTPAATPAPVADRGARAPRRVRRVRGRRRRAAPAGGSLPRTGGVRPGPARRRRTARPAAASGASAAGGARRMGGRVRGGRGRASTALGGVDRAALAAATESAGRRGPRRSTARSPSWRPRCVDRPPGRRQHDAAAARAAARADAGGRRLPARAARRPLRAGRAAADAARAAGVAARAGERRRAARAAARDLGAAALARVDGDPRRSARRDRAARRRLCASAGERRPARLLAHLRQDPLQPRLDRRVDVRHRRADRRMALGDQRVHLMGDGAVAPGAPRRP